MGKVQRSKALIGEPCRHAELLTSIWISAGEIGRK